MARQNHMVRIQRNLNDKYSDQRKNNFTVQFMRFMCIREHRS